MNKRNWIKLYDYYNNIQNCKIYNQKRSINQIERNYYSCNFLQEFYLKSEQYKKIDHLAMISDIDEHRKMFYILMQLIIIFCFDNKMKNKIKFTTYSSDGEKFELFDILEDHLSNNNLHTFFGHMLGFLFLFDLGLNMKIARKFRIRSLEMTFDRIYNSKEQKGYFKIADWTQLIHFIDLEINKESIDEELLLNYFSLLNVLTVEKNSCKQGFLDHDFKKKNKKLKNNEIELYQEKKMKNEELKNMKKNDSLTGVVKSCCGPVFENNYNLKKNQKDEKNIEESEQILKEEKTPISKDIIPKNNSIIKEKNNDLDKVTETDDENSNKIKEEQYFNEKNQKISKVLNSKIKTLNNNDKVGKNVVKELKNQIFKTKISGFYNFFENFYKKKGKIKRIEIIDEGLQTISNFYFFILPKKNFKNEKIINEIKHKIIFIIQKIFEKYLLDEKRLNTRNLRMTVIFFLKKIYLICRFEKDLESIINVIKKLEKKKIQLTREEIQIIQDLQNAYIYQVESKRRLK